MNALLISRRKLFITFYTDNAYFRRYEFLRAANQRVSSALKKIVAFAIRVFERNVIEYFLLRMSGIFR